MMLPAFAERAGSALAGRDVETRDLPFAAAHMRRRIKPYYSTLRQATLGVSARDKGCSQAEAFT